MHYYIDGYNLLFQTLHPLKDLRAKREKMVELLQEKLSALDLSLTIVFDGSHYRGEESGFQYLPSLQIIFTPKGQSADEYILEKLSHTLHPSEYTIVTSDKALSQKCRGLGAHTKNIADFMRWASKKSTLHDEKEREPTFKDSKKNIERLLKIFEKKFQEDSNL